MSRSQSSSPSGEKTSVQAKLKRLRPQDIALICPILRKVGPLCEIDLLIENGQIRYINVVTVETIHRPKSMPPVPTEDVE